MYVINTGTCTTGSAVVPDLRSRDFFHFRVVSTTTTVDIYRIYMAITIRSR
jgi:hypothetical protein